MEETEKLQPGTLEVEIKKKDTNVNVDLISREEIPVDTYLFSGGLLFYIGYRLPRIIIFLIGLPVFMVMAFIKPKETWEWAKMFGISLATSMIFAVLALPCFFVIFCQYILMDRNWEKLITKDGSPKFYYIKAFIVVLLCILVAKETTQGLKNIYFYCFFFIKSVVGKIEGWNNYVLYGFGYVLAVIPGVMQILISLYIFHGLIYLISSLTDVFFITVWFGALTIILEIDNFVWSFLTMMNFDWIFSKIGRWLRDDADIIDEVIYEVGYLAIKQVAVFNSSELPKVFRGVYHVMNVIMIILMLIYSEISLHVICFEKVK